MSRRLYDVVMIWERHVESQAFEEVVVAVTDDPLPHDQAVRECDTERLRNHDPSRQFYVRDAGLRDFRSYLPR